MLTVAINWNESVVFIETRGCAGAVALAPDHRVSQPDASLSDFQEHGNPLESHDGLHSVTFLGNWFLTIAPADLSRLRAVTNPEIAPAHLQVSMNFITLCPQFQCLHENYWLSMKNVKQISIFV